jgi:hypothetical protein
MATERIRQYRGALDDPAARPSALDLAVGLAYALLGVGAALVDTVVDGGVTVAEVDAGLRSLYAFALALLYLRGSYTVHWHAKYTFERAAASFHLGTLGAVLGFGGLVVQFVSLQFGIGLAAAGAFSNVLGGS